MECKKCGTSCPDDAAYCGKCGSRLDGKKPCPACGNLVDGQSTYCIYCGKRIDGKSVCVNCGEAYEGNFCPVCGTGMATRKKKTATDTGVKTDKTKLASWIKGGVAMLGVLFAFVFVFLIGVKTDVAGMMESESETLFYYFGDFYKEVRLTDFSELEFTPWYTRQMQSQTYAVGIFGTVIAALSLLSVILFSLVAIIVYVRGLVGHTQKKAGGWAVAAMLSYLTGAAAFVGLHVIEVQSGGIAFSDTVTISNATKAGVILCSIVLGGYFACRFVFDAIEKKKNLFTKGFVVKAVCAILGVGFAATVFALAKNTGFTMKLRESGTLGETFMSFPLASVEIVSIFGVLGVQIPRYTQIAREVDMACGWNTVAQIALWATLISAAVAIGANLKRINGKKNRGAILSSVACLTFAVLLLVASVASWNRVDEAFKNATSLGYVDEKNVVDTSFAKSICALVFSALLFVITIIQTVLQKRENAREAYFLQASSASAYNVGEYAVSENETNGKDEAAKVSREEAQYLLGIQMVNEGKYREAKNVFLGIDDYKNAKNYLELLEKLS